MILNNWATTDTQTGPNDSLYVPVDPDYQPVIRAECGEYYTVEGFWIGPLGVSMLKLWRTTNDGTRKHANLPPHQVVDMPDGSICTDYELDCLLVRFRERTLETC